MDILDEIGLNPELLEARFVQDNFGAFRVGVWAGFVRWPAIALAVTHGWTSNASEKREALYDQVIQMFYKNMDGKVSQDKLADFLYTRAQRDFNTDLDDESDDWMARLCLQLWQDCMVKKDFVGLIRMLGRIPNLVAQEVEHESDEDDEEDEQMDDEKQVLEGIGELDVKEQQQQKELEGSIPDLIPTEQDDQGKEKEKEETPLVDDDGWNTVPSKKKKRGGRR